MGEVTKAESVLDRQGSRSSTHRFRCGGLPFRDSGGPGGTPTQLGPGACGSACHPATMNPDSTRSRATTLVRQVGSITAFSASKITGSHG